SESSRVTPRDTRIPTSPRPRWGFFFIGPVVGGAEASGDFLPPSPPAEKATASKDQAGQSGTDDGAGNGQRKARVKPHLIRAHANDVGADALPIGRQVRISYPGLKIAGEEGRDRPCCREQ